MEKQYYVQMKDVNKSFGSFQASKNINFGILMLLMRDSYLVAF